ncbi:MAG: DUF975 family protein [Lachnospiraceae bacterium]|nr:DUF975 family protein [Lachnospiraceae bacterium]
MKTNLSVSDLKAFAKEHLFGNYGALVTSVILAQLLIFLLSRMISALADMTSLMGIVIYYLIYILVNLLAGILSYGQAYQYLSVASGKPTSVSDLFAGFKQSGEQNAAITQSALLLTLLASCFTIPSEVLINLYYSSADDLYLILSGAVILVIGIPVLILALMFSQVYYILLDFPRYTAKEAFSLSKRLMKGNKLRLFLVLISFIPIGIIGLLTLGLGFFWILPYINCTMAEFYLDLVKKQGKQD